MFGLQVAVVEQFVFTQSKHLTAFHKIARKPSCTLPLRRHGRANQVNFARASDIVQGSEPLGREQEYILAELDLLRVSELCYHVCVCVCVWLGEDGCVRR